MVEEQNQGNAGKPFREASPDEVREQVQEKVAGAVGKAADLMHKATDTMGQGAGKATEALKKTGEATRDVGKVAVEEARRTKQDVRGGQG